MKSSRTFSFCERHLNCHIELLILPLFQTPIETARGKSWWGKSVIVQNWKRIPPTYQTFQGISLRQRWWDQLKRGFDNLQFISQKRKASTGRYPHQGSGGWLWQELTKKKKKENHKGERWGKSPSSWSIQVVPSYWVAHRTRTLWGILAQREHCQGGNGEGSHTGCPLALCGCNMQEKETLWFKGEIDLSRVPQTYGSRFLSYLHSTHTSMTTSLLCSRQWVRH